MKKLLSMATKRSVSLVRNEKVNSVVAVRSPYTCYESAVYHLTVCRIDSRVPTVWLL